MIDFSELIEPTLDVLKESEEGLFIKEIDERLVERVDVSKEELNKKHQGSRQSEFSYRAAWARTYLKKYGLLKNPERGFWKLNDNYSGEKVSACKIIETVRNQQNYTSEMDVVKEHDIASENKKYIEELAEIYIKHKICLFLGAGVSMAANMPSWGELITKFLIERFKGEMNYKLNDHINQELEKLAEENGENSPLMQTRFVKQNMEPEKYLELLMESVYQNEENIDNDLFENLVKLIRKRNMIYIKEIVTYNFDDLLEEKLKQRDIYYESYDNYSLNKNEDSVNIYHVHGYLGRESKPDEVNLDNIIFSEEQYHKMYKDTYNWSNLKQIDMLREKTGLFIGCSLSDPNMRRLLDIVYKENETKHYAIMKKEKIKVPKSVEVSGEAYKIYQDFYLNNRNAYYNSLGIYVIWIDEFDEIPGILRKIGGCE